MIVVVATMVVAVAVTIRGCCGRSNQVCFGRKTQSVVEAVGGIASLRSKDSWKKLDANQPRTCEDNAITERSGMGVKRWWMTGTSYNTSPLPSQERSYSRMQSMSAVAGKKIKMTVTFDDSLSNLEYSPALTLLTLPCQDPG